MSRSAPDPARELLRHAVATLAYRGGKVLRDVPDDFASFRLAAAPDTAPTRTPLAILAHVGDLFDWGCHLLRGVHLWREAPLGSWDEQVARFFDGLARFDALLAAPEPPGYPFERLFQGPVADAFTHVGQLAMLRRLAGLPVRGENYFKAEIAAGRVGREQSLPRHEFD